MGLFSRETTVSVASVIYPLGEELDRIPDVVKAAVITAGLQDTSRSDAIRDSIIKGAGIKLIQGYNYASKYYYAGLPTGYPVAHLVANDPLLEMLCEEYLTDVYPASVVDVKTVSVSYASNVDTIVRQQIESAYNYDFFADAVHTAVGAVDVDASLEYVPLPQDLIGHPTESGYRLTFTNPDTTEEVIDVWYSNILFAGEDTLENRILMEVVLDSDPAFTLSYAYGGADARLNLYLRTLATPQSGTFPAIVLKKKNKYLNTDDFTGTPWATSSAYRTSKVYAQRLGLNLDDLLALVEDNPDEHKIDYAFIQPGTLLTSPNQAAQEYHFNYFHRLFLSMPDNKPAYDAWVSACSYPGINYVSKNLARNCPAQSVRILDPDAASDSVNMEIAWRHITYEVKSGALATPYVVECGTQEEVNSRWRNGRVSFKTENYDVTKLYLRKRLTESTYAELVVTGLWHENYIYKNHTVQSGVWDMFNDPEGDFGTGFLIPLEYEVFLSLSARERLQLSQEAFHIIFNCYKVTKAKWYQTGIFKVVLAIVGIVVIYLSAGTLSAQVGQLYAAIVAALPVTMALATVAAIAAVLTALVVVGVSIGVSKVAEEAGEWAAEQWGPAWGAVVQIVTTIALSWGIGKGLDASIGYSVPPTGLAETVLSASSMILAGLSTYTDAQYAELREEQKKWTDYITSPDNPMKELERLMEEWFPENSTQDLARDALFGPKESLDQFLGRTLTLVDGLTYRLTLPISNLSELTLTPRLV